jgi:superfamily II DNA or RNA helicase
MICLAQFVQKCTSWNDFQQACLPLSNKEKGDLFEELVKAWLLLDPTHASKLKRVWLLREVPPSVTKRLKLPSTDQGIDLVAETREGEFWAVQCKYRQETNQSLTFREVSTFGSLAFTVCDGFSYGLICSTTERFTKTLAGAGKIGFATLDAWLGLDAAFFSRLRAHLGNRPAKLKPLRPRPHQKAAVKDARTHFVEEKAKRGKLIMPCGSGKSLTAYWIAGDLGSRRIVVAVPSLALIRQTLNVWLREAMAEEREVDWICVCSDESAGRIERDDVAVLRQDLGLPCLTDPEEITTWLGRKRRETTVVFTTYQSGAVLAKAARAARFTFDLGIFDEAHKTVGDTAKLFSHLLHDENLRIRQRLFMTATERRYQGSSDTILSMDDAEVYGETFHLLSFKRAMEVHPPILSDYRILTLSVSRGEVADLIRRNAFVRPDRAEWSEEVEAQMLASLIALRKAMHKHPIRHAVSFHASIARAERFRDDNETFTRLFRRFGRVEAFHVSGKTPTGTRARVIEQFATAERSLVTNARCLTEGVDVPGIDAVLFADPRRSAVDIVQAVGRALRAAEGKECGYVILPILHEDDATAEDILESDAFKEILTTLRALAANDDRIIEYFRDRAAGRQAGSGGGVSFEIDERLAKRIDLEAFVRGVEVRCWDRLAKLSWRPFEEAREFVRGLGLGNGDEWRAFTKSAKRPADIPANPMRTYGKKCWVSMGDWLGTGRVANRNKSFRPFEEARAFTRSLNLKNVSEWKSLCAAGNLPSDVPVAPWATYRGEGWKGFGDWLGTRSIATFLRKYQPFRKARAFARRLGLNNRDEWSFYAKSGKLPSDIPNDPVTVYRDSGWVGWGDWLGTGRIAHQNKQYRPFQRARSFARKLNLANQADWLSYVKSGKLPPDIPGDPRNAYKDKGWTGMGDWLGTGTVAPQLRQYRSFSEAQAYARSLGLRSGSEWKSLGQAGSLPSDIPSNPAAVYADKGWTGFSDWLGTGTIALKLRNYRPFAQARSFARSLNLKNGDQWRDFVKSGGLPSDIPATPERIYKKEGWTGLGDWLGTDTIATHKRRYRSFTRARSFARSLKLRNKAEWTSHLTSRKLEPDIPADPRNTYKDKGWSGWRDWLGTD